MELEGDGERGFEPAFTIFAPCQERIVDYAVLVDNAIEFRTCHSRCADFGGIIVQEVLAGLAGGLCQMNVIGIEPLQIVGNGNVAETKLTLDVLYDHVYDQMVVLIQFPVLWRQVKLLDPRCRLADAPAQEHIEFQPAPTARLTQPRHVEGLCKRHHRHGRIHPQPERLCSRGLFGIKFLFHISWACRVC